MNPVCSVLVLGSVPWYGYDTAYLTFHWLKDICSVQFWTTVNKAAITSIYKVLCGLKSLFSEIDAQECNCWVMW